MSTVPSEGVTPQEPEITEEMIAAGAKALNTRGWHGSAEAAHVVLSAALAGRTVVARPPHNDLRADEMGGGFVWKLRYGTRVEAYHDGHQPRVDLLTRNGDGYGWPAERARVIALAMLAAADRAEGLASESRKDGETRECPAHGAHPHDGMKCLDCPLCVEGGAP